MTTYTLTHGRVTWINITPPSEADLAALGRQFPNFHPLNLQDCMNPLEYPKLDAHADYLFLVVHFPVFEKIRHLSQATEIDIFVMSGVLVTVHHGQLPPILDLFASCQKDEEVRREVMGRGASPLLYALLDRLVDYCFPIMRKVEANIRHIEEHLLADATRHILLELAVVRRDVIALRRIIRPQYDIVRQLGEGSWPWIHEELDIYWSDIRDHLGQLRAMLDDDYEVMSGLAETLDTLASHRIDEVVRLLTLATITTLPLTVVSTIYSMNVEVPGKSLPITFWIVLVLALAITSGILWYLRRRDWL
jgi:magnesium transporter